MNLTLAVVFAVLLLLIMRNSMTLEQSVNMQSGAQSANGKSDLQRVNGWSWYQFSV